jgi:very-short-patch-repair endonuclease
MNRAGPPPPINGGGVFRRLSSGRRCTTALSLYAQLPDSAIPHCVMRTPEQLRADVRRLRREQSEAESLLWQNLRAKRLDGLKFRRQHPIGGHIADFCCLRHRLVIEIDGSQHADEIEQDAVRTRRLEANGFRVIRFCNDDVLRNLEGVLTSIVEAVGKSIALGAGPEEEAEVEFQS